MHAKQRIRICTVAWNVASVVSRLYAIAGLALFVCRNWLLMPSSRGPLTPS